MSGNFVIVIFFMCFWLFGFFIGNVFEEIECEKLVIELKNYPKCQTTKAPLYCVRQYKKIEDLERQIDNDR